MAHVRIEPVTADRFGDAEHTLSGGGDGHGCQCQWWMMPNVEFQNRSVDERRRMLQQEVADGPPPALIAYVDDEPAGWVRVGPRTRQVRLARTRNYAAHSEEPWDDETVWAVSCFVVRREHRQQGLNAQLLAAAVDYARSAGARVLEAYPVDPGAGRKKASNDLYHGVVSTFEEARFREVARPRPDVAIVSLDLSR